MAEFKERPVGPTKLYELKNCCIDLDDEKLNSTDNGKRILAVLFLIEKKFKIPRERIYFTYFGSTTKDSAYRRAYEHFTNEGSPFWYFKKPPEVVYDEYIGDFKYTEGESYEELRLEATEEYYTQLFLKKGIFCWPMGPFDPKDKGKSQKTHPYPDNKHGGWPRWLRNLSIV